MDLSAQPTASEPSGTVIEKKAASARRGGNLYFVASLISQAAALLRYVLLARLLGPEQLGLAATLVVTASFFDLISDTGSDKFLIQDRHGDRPEVQKLVHTVYIGRGLAIAASLVIFAIPISWLYREPRLVVGLCFLALSPLIMGFLHLDLRRSQRRHDFRADAVSTIAGESASLIVTLTAAWITRNYTAILYGLIVRSLVIVLVSHIMAERRYVAGWAKEHATRLAAFSGPLMLTGLMLFVGSQADRVVVANQLGPKALGLYSAVLLMIYYSAGLISRYMNALYIPIAAASRDDPNARDKVDETLGGQVLLLAIAMAVGFAIVAPYMVTLLFGNRYRETSLLVGLIGILQTTRFLIAWPTAMALGMGHSRTVLFSNLARISVLPCAFLGMWLLGGLEGVVSGFIVGELIAIATALVLLNRLTTHGSWSRFDRLGLYVMVALEIIGLNIAIDRRSWIVGAILLGGGAFVAIGLIRRERAVIRDAYAFATKAWRSAALRVGLQAP